MHRTAFANIVKRTKPQTDEQALRSSTLKTLAKRGRTLRGTWAIVLTGQTISWSIIKVSTSDSIATGP